ncbi:methyltransferase [Kitasatospora sp. NPDC001119]
MDSTDNELQFVLDTASGFWRARTLFAGVELGLFTYLEKGPASESDIVRELGLHHAGARDFLDALAAVGLLRREAAGYVNSDAASRYLDFGKDSYVGGFLAFMSHALYPAWGRLTELLRTGDRQEGVDSFGEWYRDLDQVRGFMAAMDSVSAAVTAELTRRLDWDKYQTFTDLGGARGNLTANLAKSHSQLRGTCFDMPAVQPLFEEHIAGFGLGDRVKFQGGDFLTDPLPAADVLIFGHVLHDWDETTRRQLVKRAYEAVNPGGALVIYDELLDDDRNGPERSLLMSLNMRLVRTGGSEYTVTECRTWLTEAGFTDIRVEDLTATERLVVAHRPLS